MKYRILFFPIVLAILFYYTGFKLNQFAPNRKLLNWALNGAVFLVIMGSMLAYRLPQLSIDSLLMRGFFWVGSLTMGLWASFLIYSLPIDVLNLAYLSIRKFLIPQAFDPIKRDFLAVGVPSGLLGLAGGSSALGFLEAASGPKIQEVTVPIENLPADLDGLKIAQISDLHVGPTIRKNFVAQVVRQVLDTQPDLIAVTGDLIDGTPERLAQHIEPLAGLKAPLGVFYVTGNHEYYWGAEDWLRTVKQLGFTPLLNENRLIQIKSSNLLLGGVTDTGAHDFIESHRSSPSKAALHPQNSDLRILLAHRPDSCLEAEPSGFQLQLSGHTHAGQFFPWNFLVKLAHRYYRGLNRHGKMWVYVNAGTGYWGPAHRFLIPSEITLIRLKSATQGDVHEHTL